jgi:hypothetical protein
MANGVPDFLVLTQPNRAEKNQTANHRNQTHWNVQVALAHRVERVNGNERAQTGVNRMAKAQHAALAQQNVVAQASNDGDAHLAQHGVAQAAGEQHGGHHQQQCEQAPNDPTANVERFEFVCAAAHLNPPACPTDLWA